LSSPRAENPTSEGLDRLILSFLEAALRDDVANDVEKSLENKHNDTDKLAVSRERTRPRREFFRYFTFKIIYTAQIEHPFDRISRISKFYHLFYLVNLKGWINLLSCAFNITVFIERDGDEIS
jgi:hypothetical protein